MSEVLDIGKSIKARREAIGLTQAELAAAAGYKQSLISELETGARKRPSYATVMAIQAVLSRLERERAACPPDSVASGGAS